MKPSSSLVSVHRLRIKCPVCGKRDNCAVSQDGTFAYCRREGIGAIKQGRDGGFLHRLTAPVEWMQSAHARIASPNISAAAALSRNAETDVATLPESAASRAYPLPDAEAERRNLIYNALLTDLTLESFHAESLASRGLSPDTIARNLYASVPASDDLAAIVTGLGQDFDLRGIPGFYRHGNQWRASTQSWTALSGIFVPIRDAHSRISALSIRRDCISSSKYIWFSSARKPHGASSGAPAHFVNPHLVTDTIYITEGSLKADAVGELAELPIIGLAGLSFRSGFALELLHSYPALKTVILVFDADFRTNRNVHRAVVGLARALNRDGGFQVRTQTWTRAKGFDDFLLS